MMKAFALSLLLVCVPGVPAVAVQVAESVSLQEALIKAAVQVPALFVMLGLVFLFLRQMQKIVDSNNATHSAVAKSLKDVTVEASATIKENTKVFAQSAEKIENAVERVLESK